MADKRIRAEIIQLRFHIYRLGGEIAGILKRDDLTNPKYGGNKLRKYEFVIPYLQKRKKKHILTVGGLGTNHGLANVIIARDFGIKTSLYLVDQPLTQHVRENLLCDFHFGAELNYTKDVKGTAYHLLKDLIFDRAIAA